VNARDPARLQEQLQEELTGRYRIERELGRGSMARVYLAEDLVNARQVAVKLLPPELASSSNAERFLREIQITAALQHPNILALLDSGVSGASSGLYWYVMPYVEGQTLRERLASGPLTIENAFVVAVQVGAALAYAHPKGIVHRDLKPENVMCSGGQHLVMDFGLARALDSNSRLTGTGMPLGTPAYMSPEQILGAESVDARADLYSFGCLLYEAFTGRMPFSGKSVVHILQAHMQTTPAPPSQVRTGIPASVDRALLKVMAKEPRNRHQTADELIRDLTEGGIEAGTTRPPAEPGQPAGGFLARLFSRRQR
jgi:serine/threonine protein kinase